jgi:hypothetical protein
VLLPTLERALLNSRLSQDMKPSTLAFLSLLAVAPSEAHAQDLGPTSAPPAGWKALAASADGNRIVAVVLNSDGWGLLQSPLYTSADGGGTWILSSAPYDYWSTVASSVNGATLIAASERGGTELAPDSGGGAIYISRDSGTSWVKSSAPTNDWSALAASADGLRLVAAARRDVSLLDGAGSVYTSTNAGLNWVQAEVPRVPWNAAACSADGAKVVIAAGIDYNSLGKTGGLIYTSADSGATWTPTSAPSLSWQTIASSADGTKVLAASDREAYVSTNGGGDWTLAVDGAGILARLFGITNGPDASWTSAACSADGALLAVAGDWGRGQSIYESRDGGATWAPNRAYSSGVQAVAMAADGSKLLVATTSGHIDSSSPLPSTWKPSASPSDMIWSALACSSNGTMIVAASLGAATNAASENGPIYTSTDSGATWVLNRAPERPWVALASSADGSKLAAASYSVLSDPGAIYTSSDSGASWMPSNAPAAPWRCLASSADGGKLFAASELGPSGGRICVSPDSGSTWVSSSPVHNWTSVACSADGIKVVAADIYDPAMGVPPGFICVSGDSGVTWTQTSAPNRSWWSVASSGDGSTLAAAAEDGIYLSADSGGTWVHSAATPVIGIAISADGRTLVASAPGSPSGVWDYAGLIRISCSSDAGATWIPASPPADFDNDLPPVALSGGGSRVFVAPFGAPIYHFQMPLAPPGAAPWSAPRLGINSSATGLKLSWLVPSKPLVLQANSNLSTTNWTQVTTPGILNLATLRYEVAIQLDSTHSFYRLNQP